MAARLRQVLEESEKVVQHAASRHATFKVRRGGWIQSQLPNVRTTSRGRPFASIARALLPTCDACVAQRPHIQQNSAVFTHFPVSLFSSREAAFAFLAAQPLTS